jgi:hypothetical protein
MERYQARIVDGELDQMMPMLPAISLGGAKGVGKTETASRRAARTLERQVGGALIDKVVLTTGEFAYRDQNGTAVIPLALLGS